MLGRSALADPHLSHSVAHELGLLEKRPVGPLASSIDTKASSWLPWIEGFVAVSLPFSDHPLYVTRRVKQWLKHAQTQGRLTWFEEIKRLENPQEIVAQLRRLAQAEALALSEASQTRAELN